MAWFVLHAWRIQKQEHAWEVMGHARERREVDRTLRASGQRTAFREINGAGQADRSLLGTKQERLIRKDSQRLEPERID